MNDFAKRKRDRGKTVTRTFRIKKEWDDILQHESEKQGLSVNVLMNKILRKFSLYTRWSELNNELSLPPKTLREILNTVQADSLAEAASRRGTLDSINIANEMGLKSDYDSFIYLLTEHFGGPHFAQWFQCFHHIQGDKDVFHLQHDLGHNWSVYLEAYILSCLRSMIDADVKTRVYEYAVTFEVTRPRTRYIDKR